MKRTTNGTIISFIIQTFITHSMSHYFTSFICVYFLGFTIIVIELLSFTSHLQYIQMESNILVNIVLILL